MDLPPRFGDNGINNLVCKLKQSLYGLKQSPTAWFERLTRTIKGHSFTQRQTNHTYSLGTRQIVRSSSL